MAEEFFTEQRESAVVGRDGDVAQGRALKGGVAQVVMGAQ